MRTLCAVLSTLPSLSPSSWWTMMMTTMHSFWKGRLILIPCITDIAAMVLHLNFSLICWEEISSDTSPKDTEALIRNVWRADVNSWTLHSTRLTTNKCEQVNQLYFVNWTLAFFVYTRTLATFTRIRGWYYWSWYYARSRVVEYKRRGHTTGIGKLLMISTT